MIKDGPCVYFLRNLATQLSHYMVLSVVCSSPSPPPPFPFPSLFCGSPCLAEEVFPEPLFWMMSIHELLLAGKSVKLNLSQRLRSWAPLRFALRSSYFCPKKQTLRKARQKMLVFSYFRVDVWVLQESPLSEEGEPNVQCVWWPQPQEPKPHSLFIYIECPLPPSFRHCKLWS